MAKIIIKVNSKGVKTKRLKCPKGYRIGDNGTSCVPITGAEKSTKRKAIRQAVRTKRAEGAGARKKATRKRLKAMKRRKQYGL